MKTIAAFSATLALAVWVLFFSGCASIVTIGDNDDSGTDAVAQGDAPTFDDGGCTGNAALVITPQNLTIDVVVGQALPAQLPFQVTLFGKDVTSQVQWTITRPDIGTVDASHTFIPSGSVGGVDTLQATVCGASGAVTATVTIHQTIGVPSSILDNPTGGADPSAQIVNPYDQTVFPLGVLGPEVQWNGVNASDIYKIAIKEKYYDYVEYFSNVSTPARHLLTDANWAAIAASGSGPKSDPITFSLTRGTSSNIAYSPLTQTWHVAQDSLNGLVYYWQLPGGATAGNPNCCGLGSIVRLRVGDTTPHSFINIPSSWAPGNPSPGCWGCHNVSRDGKKMVANFNGSATQTIGTIDLGADGGTLGSVVPNEDATGGVDPVFDPTSNYVIFSAEGNTASGHFTGTTGGINLMDAKTGAILKNTVMPAGCSEPAWSPDGKHAAASCNLGGSKGNCGGGWFFECSVGDISVAPVSGTTFGATSTIIPANGVRNGQPDFSPDSQWLVYTTLAKDDFFMSGSNASNGGELWLTDLTGANNVHLANASGAVSNRSARAKFTPLRAGGYSWIVFESTRDYGNEIVGLNPPHAQLWIAAIDDPPTGSDPSHPAFYLRGQDPTWLNMQAQMALPPCKDQGASCSTGSDCCNHSCVEKNNKLTCEPTGGCAATGNGCTTKSDCCDPSAVCEDGFCKLIIN